MATGLFSSASPQEMEQALLDQRAAASAALTPDQRIGALAYKAGAGATRGLGQAMGVDMQDPMIRRATMARQIAAKYPTDTAEGLMAFARDPELMASDPEMASKAMAQARTMQTQDVTTQTAQQNLRKITNTNNQEASLREALTALGPDAPEKDILAAVTKFGTADNILKVINTSSDKAAARTAAAAAVTANNEAKMERLQAQNASQEAINRQAVEGRATLAAILASAKGAPKLAVGLQKAEDDDLAKINSGVAQQTTFAKPLASLKADPETGVPLLQLGPLNNQRYKLDNARGRSTPASRAYEQYQAAFTEATNIKTDAARGVQTDSDVLRQANGIITAFGKNDNATSIAALERFNTAIDNASAGTKKIIEARRKSQGVEAYYGAPAAAPTRSGALGTPGNPIRLD
jgi:hypothetical protein